MSQYKFWIFILVLVGSFVLCACDPNVIVVQPEEPAPASCTSISPAMSATVGASGDISGVTIPNGTVAEFDGGGYWCGDPVLGVTKINVDAVVAASGCFDDFATPVAPSPCAPFNALAAIDIEPSDISFKSSLKPELRYDLAANQPACMLEGVECGDFAIYQLYVSTPSWAASNWRYVGDAVAGLFGSTPVATGEVDHFSVFALLELPEPTPVPIPSQSEMIIASDFLDNGRNMIRVSVAIVQSETEAIKGTRLFTFSNIDPALDEASLPEGCFNSESLADTLTCTFPIGTSVLLQTGIEGQSNLNSILHLEGGYEARLYANVEVH